MKDTSPDQEVEESEEVGGEVEEVDKDGGLKQGRAESLGSDMMESIKDEELTSQEPSKGVDLHYDKDEDIAASFGLGIFPQVNMIAIFLGLHYLRIPNVLPLGRRFQRLRISPRPKTPRPPSS